MPDAIIDLRSDTVTRPTPAMRRAMAEAEVGDDVFGEDPTVRRLEERVAAMLGKDAGLFVPSGTLGNQLAVHLQAPRGTEVVLGGSCHIYDWELAAMAAISGTLPRTVDDSSGRIAPDSVRAAVRGGAYYVTRTSLVCLENTHNMHGGAVLEPEEADRLVAAAADAGLPVHLDGARLWNASVATGASTARLARGASTVMVCLSKGLGAPVGSILAGPAELIREARTVRRRLGGGMRQVGVLAAAGLVAVETMVERLAEDHALAARLADAARDAGLALVGGTPRTNIVLLRPATPGGAEALCRRLEEEGVRALAFGPDTVRLVTHHDLPEGGAEGAVAAVRRAAEAKNPLP